MNTADGNDKKVLKVEECSPHVLATVVDFIYGIRIPYDCSFEDARSLLAMADLYLMEDLKDAVATLIAIEYTRRQTILEVSEVAERFSNKKLKKICSHFIYKNLDTLDKNVLTALCEAMPSLREKALLELQQTRGRPNNVEIANKVFGINLKDPFKKRVDFQNDKDYKGYVMARIEPNMLVESNCGGDYRIIHDIDDDEDHEDHEVSRRTIGRVINVDFMGATIRWNAYSEAQRSSFLSLDLLTPPISTAFFKD